MEPSLNQVIGNNSTQNNQFLNVAKVDLSSTGLTIATANSAVSLVVAILLKAAGYLNSNNQTIDPDIQLTIQQLDEQPIVRRYSNYYRQVTFVISLRKNFNNEIDPDDY